MCELSKKLKLCTCAVASVEHLRHYWVLYRFNKTKDDLVMGQAMLLEEPGKAVQAYNRSLLLERLNEHDAFDINLNPQEGDRLQLKFTCSDSGVLSILTRNRKIKKIIYGYTYRNGRWIEEPFDHLAWERRHDREKFGEIQSALR